MLSCSYTGSVRQCIHCQCKYSLNLGCKVCGPYIPACTVRQDFEILNPTADECTDVHAVCRVASEASAVCKNTAKMPTVPQKLNRASVTFTALPLLQSPYSSFRPSLMKGKMVITAFNFQTPCILWKGDIQYKEAATIQQRYRVRQLLGRKVC